MIRIEQNRAVGEARSRRGSKLPPCLGRTLFRVLQAFCLVLVHAFTPGIAAGQQDSAGEYELKAAMLYNLTHFVEWPTAAYADAQAPTVLCILGRDPFGDSLTSLVSKQSASVRAVQIRRIANDKGIRSCHVVYISSSERKSIAQVLSTLKGTSVLTVGEMAQFAARGGMIQFSLEEKQVHFEINLEAASEVDLKISSRLLVLARIVKEQNKNSSREGSALWTKPEFAVASARTGESGSRLEWNSLEATIPSNAGEELRRSR